MKNAMNNITDDSEFILKLNLRKSGYICNADVVWVPFSAFPDISTGVPGLGASSLNLFFNGIVPMTIGRVPDKFKDGPDTLTSI